MDIGREHLLFSGSSHLSLDILRDECLDGLLIFLHILLGGSGDDSVLIFDGVVILGKLFVILLHTGIILLLSVGKLLFTGGIVGLALSERRLAVVIFLEAVLQILLTLGVIGLALLVGSRTFGVGGLALLICSSVFLKLFLTGLERVELFERCGLFLFAVGLFLHDIPYPEGAGNEHEQAGDGHNGADELTQHCTYLLVFAHFTSPSIG